MKDDKDICVLTLAIQQRGSQVATENSGVKT